MLTSPSSTLFSVLGKGVDVLKKPFKGKGKKQESE